MFEHYVPKEITYLPFSGESIRVSLNGDVIDRHGNKLIQTKVNGRWTVTLNWIDGKRPYDVGLIVAFALKGKINLPHYHINKVSVMFADGNSDNHHPANLVWKFPQERLLYLPDVNFAYIPALTNYVISRDGRLLNAFSKKEIKPHFDKKYAKFKLVMDTGHLISIGRHRLICLAWMDYPSHVDDLVVNHKDGIPGNDRCGNLELIPRSKNKAHASENGLLTKGRSVLVRDVSLGTVTKYSGTTTCARALGLNRATVRYRLEAPNQPVWFGGIQMKYGWDETPWREVDPNELDRLTLNKGGRKELYIRNIHTGDITKCRSVQEASRLSGVPVMTIHAQVRKTAAQRPINGYDFSFESNRWRDYSEEELFVFSHNLKGRITACYLVDSETQKKKLYPNRDDLAKELGVSSHTVFMACRDARLINNRYYVQSFY